MDILNSNLLDDMNSNLLNVGYYEKHYGASGESEADAEGEPEYENEDNTDYENEESEIGDTSGTDLPKFRQLVRQKKLEFKAQYGKAHIARTTKEICINVPYTKWDSDINCSNVCVKWNWKLECTERKKKCLGGFIGGTRRECKNVPFFKWVSGWRKKWREFKRDGGLQQLKLASKGLAPIPPSVYTPTTPTVNKQFDEYQNWSCQDLSDEYGIIAGVTFGSAPKSAITSWKNRNCNTRPSSSKKSDSDNSSDSYREGNTSFTEDSNKILGMPKGLVIGIGVAVVLLGGFMVYKNLNLKNK